MKATLSARTKATLSALTEPYMKGYSGLRADGIRIELFRCYVGDWDAQRVYPDGKREAIVERKSYNTARAAALEALRA